MPLFVSQNREVQSHVSDPIKGSDSNNVVGTAAPCDGVLVLEK
jgi:hypothetical protein